MKRARGHIKAIRLGVEANMQVKSHPSHRTWPWTTDSAAQTILSHSVNASDGLTAIETLRGRAQSTPKARIGEHVLYNIPKTITTSKVEPRWRRGVWLGTTESSDGHISGMPPGVVKRGSSTRFPHT